MGEPLRVLILEDRPADAELMLRELRRAGFGCTIQRVETEDDFRDQVLTFAPEIILADFSLPSYDGMSALSVAQQLRPDVPFIFVSGSLGEETAVESLHRGATDYILKDRMTRLGPSVRRALSDVQRKKELRQAVASVKEHKHELQFVTDHAPVILAHYGSDCRYRFVNRAFAQLFGKTQAELVGVHSRDIIGERGYAIALPFMEAALGGQTVEHEFVMERVAGRPRNYHVKYSPERDAAGAAIGFIGAALDVTERKRTEEALRSLSAQHELILNSAAEGIIGLDERGYHTFVNPVAAQALGYTPEELLGQPSHSLWHYARADGSPYPADECLIYSAYRDGKVHRVSNEVFWRKDGTSFNVEYASTPIYGDGKLRGAVVTFTDITQRMRTYGALRIQSAALHAAANAIVIADRNGTVEWINAAFTKLTGYGSEEVMGRRLGELVKSGVHDQAFYQAMWSTLTSGQVWRGQLTNRRKDGTLYPEDESITPVMDERGNISHYVAIKRDLSDEKKLQSQFLQAQKMESVGRLAGGVAHDFNNLLSVIIGWTEIAMSDLADDHPARSSLEEVLGAGQGAARLTKQLLAFSRQQMVEPTVINLNDMVMHLDRMLRRLIGEDVELITHTDAALGTVKMDAGQFEQVLLNVVVNARDAMPGGGTLRIATRNLVVEVNSATKQGDAEVAAGEYIEVSVIDSGAGMSEEVRAHIFEPFYTTKDPGKGTGLGLATCYGIMQQAGGHIIVESEVGVGTTVTLLLPRFWQHSLEPARPSRHTPIHGVETILLVEDEAAVRRVTVHMLESHGYRVVSTSSGEEALRLLESGETEACLLLTDVVLTGRLSGPALAERVRALRPHMKVLYVSGYTSDVTIVRGLVEESVELVQKPFGVEMLVRRVRDVLDGK